MENESIYKVIWWTLSMYYTVRSKMNIPFKYRTSMEFNYESPKDIHGYLWRVLKRRYHRTQMMSFSQEGFSFKLVPAFTSAKNGFNMMLKSGEIHFKNHPDKIIIDYHLNFSLFPFLLPFLSSLLLFVLEGEENILIAFLFGIVLMFSFYVIPFIWLFFLKRGDIKCLKKEFLKRK